jgi:anti-sigma factor RsiW
MTCPYFRSLLEDYVDGELPQAEADSVAKHLAACDACRAEHEATLKLKGLLKRQSVPEPHPEYWKEVSSLVLARTVDSAPFEEAEVTPIDQIRSKERASFVRSLVSVAASLGLLFAALSFGTPNGAVIAEKPAMETRGLSATSLVDDAHAEARMEMPSANRERVSEAMLLLGPPGLLGRFPEMATALGIE